MKTFPIDGQRQLKDAGQIFLPPEQTETVSGVGPEEKKKKRKEKNKIGMRGRHSKLMDGTRGEGGKFRKMGESIHKNVFLSCSGMKFVPDGSLVDLFGWRIPLS
ncbi:hypothetical protein CEXT_93431 [Caerostris extrusa]|uniref:Uncharacterized protein n=1 Tax=Caerostris extrusa TaxID=172846 RepID=A0AAV4U1Y6_CAEEX|nr:hypothetical protein CEXT_93431 [Caerostris extrusa]